MATMIIAGTRYEMPIWLKARLLEVLETEDVGVLKVESGTERGKWYYVRHDGHVAHSCQCDARVPSCAHKQAAERYLASVEVLGKEFAQDLSAHVEDELAGQEPEPEMGEMEAIAAEIVADEKIRKEVAALPDADGDAMDEIDAMQAEKARKMAAQASVAERMYRAPMSSNDGFSLLMPEKPRRKARSAA